MPHYKDPNGGIHFIEDDRFKNVLPSGCQKITDTEADALRELTDAQKWANYQAEAKSALGQTDSTVTRIAEGVALGTCAWSNGDVIAWMNYRKRLRAILSETQPQAIPGALPVKPAYPSGT